MIHSPLDLGFGAEHLGLGQDTGLGIIKLSTPNFLRTVENCIREGPAELWW